MKALTLLLAIALVVCGCSSTPNDPTAVRSALFARLRTVAMKGNLFEPNDVARLLGVKLRAETSQVAHLTADCGDGTTRWAEVTTATPSGQWWYRALPTGAGDIEIPAFTINPATRTGDPGVDYRIYHSVYCRDWPRMRDHREATLALTGLPAFTCLTPAHIKAGIPEAVFESASDGVYFMRFDGRADDDSAVVLTFTFRAGTDCAVVARLRQDQEDGYRYRRAQYKYEACRAPSDQEFCAAHPDTTWSNRELMREMVIQAYQRCGTVDTFYVKEAASGVPVAPMSRPIRREPCDGLH